MGLPDRDYMRPDRGGFSEKLRRAFGMATAAHWAVGLLVTAGITQLLLTATGHRVFVRENFALTLDGVRAGKVWELFTYALVHGDFWHLFFNALGLWFLGRGVHEECGAKKFWKLFAYGILAGAIAWAAVWSLPVASGAGEIERLRHGETLVGASAGVFALMAYYMADKLREEFRILVFLVIPVTLEGYWILGVTAALSFGGLFLTEIPMATGWWPSLVKDTMCHSAHLAGLALGFGWRFAEMKLPEWRAAKTRAAFTVLDKNAVQPASKKSADRVVETPAKPLTGDLRGEVDRILDKINAKGFGALTPEEREILEKARETLSR
jgi:membrane associated rhomboid family serine protease